MLDCIDAQLPSADYMFVDKRSGLILPVLVERKTLEDLAGSLVTPRYSQQKRLMRAVGFPLMFLIIEGELDPRGQAAKNMGPEELKRVHSGMLTSCIVDRITVLHATSRADTLRYLKAIGRVACDQYQSASHHRAPLAPQSTSSSSSSTEQHLQHVFEQIKSIKNVLDMKSIFPAMLCNLHGCTGTTAGQLAQMYGNAMGMRKATLEAFSDPSKELQFVEQILSVKKRGGAEVAIMLLRLFGGTLNHN
jgi:ERCC4-type nuclease